MKRVLVSSVLVGALTTAVHGAATLTPLVGFGGPDGWLSPADYAPLATDNTARGMAFNPVSGNLLVATRSGATALRVLNAASGAELSTMNVTGVAGGTFALNMIDVASDGAIFGGNLTVSAAANFKVYRWANQAAAPTVAYDALSGLARTGDSFAVVGAGASTRIAASGTNTVAASNFAALTTADGSSFTSTAVTSIAGTSTANNDYRLSLTFVDSDTLIGTQGTAGRVTSFGGVLADTIPLAGNQRLIDFATIGGTPVLAVADTGTSVVSVFDITTPSSPSLLASGATISGASVTNINGVGAVTWGPVSGLSATLYAMNTNNGIQAFTFTVPEPTTALLAGLGLLGFLRRCR
ncbi:MAG: PEP-CTERM sorting domain-containing protein [Verrucomicrobiales bacterium]